MLANEVTTLLHGSGAAQAAEATARGIFGVMNATETQDTAQFTATVSALPTVTISVEEIADGITVAQLFVRSGLAASGKDAKRLIAEGGARLNDTLVLDANIKIREDELVKPLKLTAGKKRHTLVVLH